MKDFLHDRPLATGSARRRQESPSISTLPPIHSPHTQPEVEIGEFATGNFPDAESLHPASHGEPQVELIPDEAGRIGHIVVTCSCGEKITLQCNY